MAERGDDEVDRELTRVSLIEAEAELRRSGHLSPCAFDPLECAVDAISASPTAPPPLPGDPVPLAPVVERGSPLSARGAVRRYPTWQAFPCLREVRLEEVRSPVSWPCLEVAWSDDGLQQGARYRLHERQILSIGRTKDNTVRLGDDSVSRRHCRVSLRDGHFMLEEHSTNGVLLNRQLLRGSGRLCEGDRLQVGRTVFVLRLP